MRSQHSLITAHCQRITEITWFLICTGHYPEDVKIRFSGKLTSTGDPYSVFGFQNDDGSQDLMVIMGSEEFAICKLLHVIGMNEFQCIGEDELVRIVYTNHSHVVCLDFFFRMAFELERACSREEVEEKAFTVLYFANVEYKETKNEGITIGFDMVILFLSALLAILLLLRWR